ncbi:helix-turn-helix domain-containing protein [Umezawaea tangerina]|uniref:Regulatory LuxR family protein n=1 Tax=Umezawaea tangerina TaxID=84725 RepID=A0A2T0SPL7_9PSEU|nr:helix-turn-helix transcriptional regulator [Umezawaea tangerina]PRY35303.1 regulatory LuxR family protein [Umezawaea tangerina]
MTDTSTFTDALTFSERETAELAAAGLTNAQIARRRFTTTSTVEQHLTKVYRKLGIASRRELMEMRRG